MWVVEPDDISKVTQFASYVYAKNVADSFRTGEVHRHPSGIGWAVFVRIPEL